MSKARPVYIADADQPLIAIPAEIEGRGVILYFADAAAVESISDEDIQAAMGAIGSFADLDWDEFVAEFERIRHASEPDAHVDASSPSSPPSTDPEFDDHPIAVVRVENGNEVVRYFTSWAELDGCVTDEDRRAALDAIGAFSELDWDEMVSGLDRIRHENDPTPIFEP